MDGMEKDPRITFVLRCEVRGNGNINPRGQIEERMSLHGQCLTNMLAQVSTTVGLNNKSPEV